MNEATMREYICTRKVRAAKIANVIACPNGIAMIEFEPPKEGNHRDISQRHMQAVTHCDNMRTAAAKAKGRYWVIHYDGHEACVDAATFEKEYQIAESP